MPSGYYPGLLWRGWSYAPCDHISLRRSASGAVSSLARSQRIPWGTHLYQHALRQEAETRARPLGCAKREQTAQEFTCISTATGQALCSMGANGSNSGVRGLMWCRTVCSLRYGRYSGLCKLASSSLYFCSALGSLLRSPAAASIAMLAQTSCSHMHAVRGCFVRLPCL